MTPQTEKKIKTRSPNYPAVTLERALKITQAFIEKYGKSSVAWEAAIKGLDYSPKSSAGMQAMASLVYYGLLKIEGKGNERRITTTDFANKIILDTRSVSLERDNLIKNAAMNPSIIKRIMETYNGLLPNDDGALDYDLKFKFHFNPATSREFIEILRKNIEYAKLYGNDIMPDENAHNEEAGMIGTDDKQGIKGETPQGMPKSPMGSPAGKERQKALYSLGGDLTVRIIFSGNSTISEKAIEKLMKLLAINKEDFIEAQQDEKKSN